MGEVDEQEQASAYRELLQHNFRLYDGRSPLFAIDAWSDELLCLAHYRLGSLTPEALRDELMALARAVREWQHRPVTESEIADMASQVPAFDEWRLHHPSDEEIEEAIARIDFDELAEDLQPQSSSSALYVRTVRHGQTSSGIPDIPKKNGKQI
jgi:hypothetical protein